MVVGVIGHSGKIAKLLGFRGERCSTSNAACFNYTSMDTRAGFLSFIRVALLDSIISNRDRIKRIVEECGGTNLRVYGSVARREERADSDADLLIDMKPDKLSQSLEMQKLWVASMQGELRSLLKHDVHVHVDAWLELKIRREIRRSTVIPL